MRTQRSTSTAGLLALLLFVAAGACQRTEYVHVGANWDALQTLEPPDETFDVEVRANDRYEVGEKLSVRVQSAKAGRVWIVRVDPDDEVSLIFPNQFAKDNAIEAGEWLSIPAEGSRWSLEADEPVGASMVAAIVTVGDADLDDVLGSEKSIPKALRLVEADPSWAVAKKVIEVEKAGP